MRDNLAEIRFQSFVLEALVNSSGMGRDVHSLCCPSSISFANHCVATLQGAMKDGSGKAAMACDIPEPCKLYLSTVAKRGFCVPTRKLILLCTQSLVLCSQ